MGILLRCRTLLLSLLKASVDAGDTGGMKDCWGAGRRVKLNLSSLNGCRLPIVYLRDPAVGVCLIAMTLRVFVQQRLRIQLADLANDLQAVLLPSALFSDYNF